MPFSTGTPVKAVAPAVHLFFSGPWWTLVLPPRPCVPLLSRGIVSDTKHFHQKRWSLWIVTCACVFSRCSPVQLFVTLSTVARQAPLFMGFSRQEYQSGLPCSPPGDLPDSGVESTSLMSPALADRFFTTSANWEAQIVTHLYKLRPKSTPLFAATSNHTFEQVDETTACSTELLNVSEVKNGHLNWHCANPEL